MALTENLTNEPGSSAPPIFCSNDRKPIEVTADFGADSGLDKRPESLPPEAGQVAVLFLKPGTIARVTPDASGNHRDDWCRPIGTAQVDRAVAGVPQYKYNRARLAAPGLGRTTDARRPWP
jgi:hypothetical protein